MKYEEFEFYGDLHHLVQPIVGILKIDYPLDTDYILGRLELVLDLADLAFGEGRTSRVVDVDRVRDLRADYGCGYFQNEEEAMKPLIQKRWLKRRSSLSGIPVVDASTGGRK